MKNWMLIATFLIASSVIYGQDIKSHYYPLEDYTSPKIFVFHFKKNPEEKQYWYIHTDPKAQTLTTIMFNDKLEQAERFVERYTDKGTELIEFDMHMSDGIVSAKPIQVDVMRWEESFDEYAYEIEFNYLENHHQLLKERRFRGYDELEVLGEKMPVAKFSSYYRFHENGASSGRFAQMSYYAKGIGFVKYERFFDDDLKVLLLDKILSEEEWNLLKSEK